MQITNIIKESINQSLDSLNLGQYLDRQNIVIEIPAEKSHGDYSTTVAMAIFSKAKSQNKVNNKAQETQDKQPKSQNQAFEYKSPRDLALAIMSEIQKNSEQMKHFVKLDIAGAGFINFYLSDAFLVADFATKLQNPQTLLKKVLSPKKYLIEHTSPNPNKAMHLGHLRNNVTGMAIAEILKAVGHDVVRDAMDNNRGIAIAKLMWGYLKFARKDGKEMTDLSYWYDHQDEWQTPEDLGLRPDRFVDELYVKAADDTKNNKDNEQIVRQMVIDWENHDKKNWALWEKVLKFSHDGQNMTLKRLDSVWDKVWHEHEHYEKGKELVKKGLEMGILRKLDDGAILTDLEAKYGLTDTIVEKSDGTALYITQDLALTKLKKDTFKADKLCWIIGPEQSLALKQMFAVCEQLGIVNFADCNHIPYGYMSIKGKGKMSSRAGNVVYIDELLDDANASVKEIMSELGDRAQKLSADEIEAIGVGAVKYSILKVGRMQAMSFDFKESISFNGNCGPYIQYAYVRCLSILEKAEKQSINLHFDTLFDIKSYSEMTLAKEERDLLLAIMRYSDVVHKAAEDFAPHLISNYLFELASMYSSFYTNHSVLDSNNELMTNFRVALTKLVAENLKHGLSLLGIKTIKKM